MIARSMWLMRRRWLLPTGTVLALRLRRAGGGKPAMGVAGHEQRGGPELEG